MGKSDIHKAIGILLRECCKRLDSTNELEEQKAIIEFLEQVIILMDMEKARNYE